MAMLQNDESVARVAVVVTCFNRKETTLHSLSALDTTCKRNRVEWRLFLADAGTDGTGESVRALYASSEVLNVGADVYWSSGMRTAQSAAITSEFGDFLLWLNDDTILDSSALGDLLDIVAPKRDEPLPNTIAVGCVRDPSTDTWSYGGYKHDKRRFRNAPILPNGSPQLADTFNGNCVLIPRVAALDIGNLDAAFSHGSGDIDYGFRAARNGFKVVVSSDYLGSCPMNPVQNTSEDTTLSIRERITIKLSTKETPFKERLYFCRKHSGHLWPYFVIRPYVGVALRALAKRSKF